jgi:hypothetical protein
MNLEAFLDALAAFRASSRFAARPDARRMEGCAHLVPAQGGFASVIPGDGHSGHTPEISHLRTENARLIAMLESHSIDWRMPTEPEPVPAKTTAAESSLSKPQKVALFRALFSGRTDVFPERWENKSKGKSGYSPTCANL